MLSPQMHALTLQQQQQIQTELARLSSVLARVSYRLDEVLHATEQTSKLLGLGRVPTERPLALEPAPVHPWSPIDDVILVVLQQASYPLTVPEIHRAVTQMGARRGIRSIRHHVKTLVQRREVRPMRQGTYTTMPEVVQEAV